MYVYCHIIYILVFMKAIGRSHLVTFTQTLRLNRTKKCISQLVIQELLNETKPHILVRLPHFLVTLDPITLTKRD